MTDREYEVIQMQARACTQGLYSYAGQLAAAGASPEQLLPIRSMVEQLYCWYGLGPDDKQENEAGRLKCMEPVERLMRGESVPLEDVTEAHQAAITNCLRGYREELREEDEPVYDADIRLCDELIKETGQFLHGADAPQQRM